MYQYKKGLTGLSKSLRKNMTRQERHLWYDFLKELPVPVKRQHPIMNYIVDFYIPSAKLVVELDGSQHYTDIVKEDHIRDTALHNIGITVVRYANNEVDGNFPGVCEDIMGRLTTSSDSLRSPPSPAGEG